MARWALGRPMGRPQEILVPAAKDTFNGNARWRVSRRLRCLLFRVQRPCCPELRRRGACGLELQFMVPFPFNCKSIRTWSSEPHFSTAKRLRVRARALRACRFGLAVISFLRPVWPGAFPESIARCGIRGCNAGPWPRMLPDAGGPFPCCRTDRPALRE